MTWPNRKRTSMLMFFALFSCTLVAAQEVIQQSTAARPLMFLMIDSSDHVSAKTGLSPTVVLSKNGATFAAAAGTVSEVPGGTTLSYGWYKVAGNATDTATAGPLILHASAAGADPTDVKFRIVPYDIETNGTLAGAGTTNATQFGGVPIATGATTTITFQQGTIPITTSVMSATGNWNSTAPPAVSDIWRYTGTINLTGGGATILIGSATAGFNFGGTLSVATFGGSWPWPANFGSLSVGTDGRVKIVGGQN